MIKNQEKIFIYIVGLQPIVCDILGVIIKAVLDKKDNAILMFIAIYVFVLAIIEDVFHYKGIGGNNVSFMFLYGNFGVVLAMSLVQAQIKPHFLYNALNAIANVCEKDGAKAGKLIVDLAIYLRGSLEFNHLDKMVTIEKELEFIDTYFNIEQARFGQKIQLIKEVGIHLEYQLPVLILQPLVENAVRHGISKKQGGGSVIVRVMQLEEDIGIEIEDDGIGIKEEKLSLLLSEKRNDQSVGLLNIHYRLMRLYGRGLGITSEVGRGTCVKLVIPEGRKSL